MLAVVVAGCLGREEPDGCDGGKSTKTEVNDGAWYERKCGGGKECQAPVIE